jgi:hypothetical protein
MSASPSASAATKPRGNAPDVPHQARMLEDHRHRQHSAARALMALASTKPVNAETEEQRKPANAETEEQRKPAKRKMRTGGGGLNGSVLFRSHQKHKLITKNNLTLEQYVKYIGSTKVARNDVRKSISPPRRSAGKNRSKRTWEEINSQPLVGHVAPIEP